MWPWEHAVIGYIAFSLSVHLLRRRSPTGREAVVVVFASALPDLIDKPLAYEFGVFPSGYGLAHSIFFAVPLSLAVLAASVAIGRANLGAAFGIGYLLHLPFDVIPAYVQNGDVPLERLLWPVETVETEYEGGFTGTVIEYFTEYATEFVTDPSGYMLGVLALMVACALLWLYDGMPGLREPVAYLLDRR